MPVGLRQLGFVGHQLLLQCRLAGSLKFLSPRVPTIGMSDRGEARDDKCNRKQSRADFRHFRAIHLFGYGCVLVSRTENRR